MKTMWFFCFCALVLAGHSASCESAEAAPEGTSITINPIFTGRMVMGDTGDLRMETGEEGSDRFVYTPAGKGPHEWEYKFINGVENPDPAGFAGVMYINSVITSEPGTQSGDGRDLQAWRQKVVWEARSIGGDANAEFVAGGITWAWDLNTKKKGPLLHPDTLPKLSLGSCSVKSAWTHCEFDVAKAHLPAKSFERVIGGFGFVIKAPRSKRPVTIEIRNVRYLGQAGAPAPVGKKVSDR
jgi:hypothetical protein